ncbi:MAG: ribbon-helix-helix protein, CopG family [Actinobacteria bacterium]|nr:ribbon-helix-helix protein, CopG family [Actinomycetota bacterium]
MPKINITLPEELLRKIDKSARDEHVTRSEFFRKAVQEYWEIEKREREDRGRARDIREAMRVQANLRKKAGHWDGVAEVRKWREVR